jgi:hypothetical protein
MYRWRRGLGGTGVRLLALSVRRSPKRLMREHGRRTSLCIIRLSADEAVHRQATLLEAFAAGVC